MNSLSVTNVDLSRKNRSNFKSTVFKNNAGQQAVVPPAPQKSSNGMSNTLPIITSAVAIASLGVATYAVVKKPKGFQSIEKSLETLTKDLGENKKATETVTNSLKNIEKSVKTVKVEAEKTVNEVKNTIQREVGNFRGELNGVKGEMNNVKGDINGIRGAVSAPKIIKNFISRPVEVNGQHLELANVMHGYGVQEEALTHQLRTETARRVLGAVKPIELPENAMIRVPTAEYAGFAKTGGLAIVPKELTANLGAVINNKQKAELIVDTPMYLGQIENSKFFSIVRNGDKYQYVSKTTGKKPEVMANLNKIDEMHIPIYTDIGKSTEKVEVFISDEMRSAVDYVDTLKQFDSETAKAIEESIAKGKDYDTNLVSFVAPKIAGDAPRAEVKYKTVFYKSDKFRMDGPVQDKKIKNIYNDQTTQAGETERNIYFGKFFYENLISSPETATKPLKADLIIGNDWHTGPIAAMVRQLTPARKAMGLEPELADKIQNTPMITIMHNFKLQGQVWHSQEKLMNIMFGEHAAKVVENSWMPSGAKLPGHLMNGMFSGTNVNPQTMAMAFADDIVFVSRGNFNEAANNAAMGGTNYALAALRGRTGEYANITRLEEIAMANGIRPNEISSVGTAKGITNGCDRVNNIITEQKARKFETDLGLKPGSIKSAGEAILKPYEVHQHNKKVYLEKIADDINRARNSGGKDNPLKLRAWESTDLTGVDENTMIHGMAGRIVDQKGIDIWAGGIEKFYERGNYNKQNPPVFYLQGVGDEQFIERFLQVKGKVAQKDPKAANRMVFAGVFSEPGRYDGCKMMSDFSGMPSWDEPCGLVHKEIGYNSGAISIVNKKGGLTDGLKPFTRGGDNKGANSIFVDFMDKDTHSYEEALAFNSEKQADAMELAQEIFENKQTFAEGIKASYEARHDWLRGKIQEYVEIAKRHGVLNDTIDSHYVL